MWQHTQLQVQDVCYVSCRRIYTRGMMMLTMRFQTPLVNLSPLRLLRQSDEAQLAVWALLQEQAHPHAWEQLWGVARQEQHRAQLCALAQHAPSMRAHAP